MLDFLPAPVRIKRLENCFKTSSRYNKRQAALNTLELGRDMSTGEKRNGRPVPISAYSDAKYMAILENTISEEALDQVLAYNKIVPCLDHTPKDFLEIQIPKRATEGSAGFDFQAAIDDSVTINPGQVAMIPTGLSVSMPQTMELQIRPRSGLAAKNSVTMIGCVGTIDSDYRGEIKVALINHSSVPFTINRGDRIAQGVFNRVELPHLIEVESLDETARGTGGFGSTGVKSDK